VLSAAGIDLPPPETRVVVAMSGGVDSSVCAALHAAAGCQVVGVTLQLYDDVRPFADGGEMGRRVGACCAGRDIHDARRVAERLGIRHYVLDYRERFAAGVIADFVESYQRGETPNPCIRCNQRIKFGPLLDAARTLEAGLLVTGHYARIAPAPDSAPSPHFSGSGAANVHTGGMAASASFFTGVAYERGTGAGTGGSGGLQGDVPEGTGAWDAANWAAPAVPASPAALLRGVDPVRDQSYFLFAIPSVRLPWLRFPLGGLGKAETRLLAARFGLPVAAKPDSQDICFVPDGDYAAVVARLVPEAARPGAIVDLEGRELGRHRGIIHYTVGQRRGLGLGGRQGADQPPLFVVRIDPAQNLVVVGPRAALACRQVRLREFNWLGPGPHPPGTAFPAWVKLRSTQPATAATVTIAADGGAWIDFAEPQFGVAPGQAGVLYEAELGERVLGGGWIAVGAG